MSSTVPQSSAAPADWTSPWDGATLPSRARSPQCVEFSVVVKDTTTDIVDIRLSRPTVGQYDRAVFSRDALDGEAFSDLGQGPTGDRNSVRRGCTA